MVDYYFINEFNSILIYAHTLPLISQIPIFNIQDRLLIFNLSQFIYLLIFTSYI